MPALYRVHLTPSDHRHLTALTRRGTTSARTIQRARVLLLAHTGLSDPQIAEQVGIHPRTVQRLRRRWAEEGVDATLAERPRSGAPPVLNASQEAHLIALACSTPPLGRTVWTMQLLAERLVELAVIDSISAETVRRRVKKATSSPGGVNSGAFPR